MYRADIVSPSIFLLQGNGTSSGAARKVEDVITKGFISGKGAVNKGKELDEKHQLTSNGNFYSC